MAGTRPGRRPRPVGVGLSRAARTPPVPARRVGGHTRACWRPGSPDRQAAGLWVWGGSPPGLRHAVALVRPAAGAAAGDTRHWHADLLVVQLPAQGCAQPNAQGRRGRLDPARARLNEARDLRAPSRLPAGRRRRHGKRRAARHGAQQPGGTSCRPRWSRRAGVLRTPQASAGAAGTDARRPSGSSRAPHRVRRDGRVGARLCTGASGDAAACTARGCSGGGDPPRVRFRRPRGSWGGGAAGRAWRAAATGGRRLRRRRGGCRGTGTAALAPPARGGGDRVQPDVLPIRAQGHDRRCGGGGTAAVRRVVAVVNAGAV
mmetsp:Transcript_5178/g.17157  ORF Transcript_5178/g.17157 Transcript_5178/m.17157 type:complete len:317 (-) Transcript_5178:2014-2964(-)